MFIVWHSSTKITEMINLDNNSYESFFLPASNDRENPYNVNEEGGQMYIGLR